MRLLAEDGVPSSSGGPAEVGWLLLSAGSLPSFWIRSAGRRRGHLSVFCFFFCFYFFRATSDGMGWGPETFWAAFASIYTPAIECHVEMSLNFFMKGNLGATGEGTLMLYIWAILAKVYI